MWVLTVVGPVNGQHQFAFALEQKRSYSIGRSKECDIRVESARVRPKEGVLTVGDWDPSNRTSPPELKWRLEPKKDKTFGKYIGILPYNDALIGSTDQGDYEETQLDQAGCWLSSNGQGIKLVDDVWFIVVWKDLHIQYDKMKDQSDQVRDTLNRYCISYTLAFDINDKPTYVLSPALRNNPDCNYAVCYAIRILLPLYLDTLISRLNACWRKIADSQDSFSLPDADETRFQPALDPAVQNIRSDVEQWLPHEARPTLFRGWKVLGLRAKITPPEKRYLQAMGADYSDIDVVTRPLLSDKDLEERLAPWIKEVDATIGRPNALLIWAAQAKAELTKKNLDWNIVVGQTCHKLGIKASSGLVTWGAVKFNSVQTYLESVSGSAPKVSISKPQVSPTQQDTRPAAANPVASTDKPIDSLPPSSQATQMPPASAGPSNLQPAFIPSTYPEETEKFGRGNRGDTRPSAVQDKSPEPSQPQPAKKVVRRRGARQLDIFGDEVSEPASMPPIYSQQTTDQPAERLSRVPETQLAGSESLATSLMTNPRLKRRGGPETQRSILNMDFDISVEEEEDKPISAELRELYEQTKAQSLQPPAKRSRLTGPPASSNDPDVALPNQLKTTETSAEEAMEVDDDPIQATLRRAAQVKRQGRTQSQNTMPPPAATARAGLRSRSPEEETEEIEDTRGQRLVAKPNPPPKKTVQRRSPVPASGDLTKDDNFLQAITKASKTKKAVDELDKEFNLLRIPKPGANPGSNAIRASEWDASHPDYNIVNDFEDDCRGNFIQIVKKDLFRKDARRETVSVDNGRPNFKKFKKKNVTRREPLQLVLAAPIAEAEMGEPYWQAEALQPAKVTQRGQPQSSLPARGRAEEDDEDMPLLPSRTHKRLLRDDDERPSSSSIRVRSSSKVSTQPLVFSTQRQTRASSVVSEVSSAGTKPATKRATKSRQYAEVPEEVEEVEMVDDNSVLGTGSRTRSGRSAASTLDGPTASSRGTQGLSGRRNLLRADDDDDGLVNFKAVSKKRRLG
ncbi:hypothetical protein BCR39DRAFT_549174 [Naematelia encephala]|uniref:Uncharacterized protein n=1 Tax=Naematelia encephala TaxID=71784 RepID=A0A1Y2ALV3_9TREE|nr:hypothetical protein BCR39DRAFT_549174 [Naematelia encephala]